MSTLIAPQLWVENNVTETSTAVIAAQALLISNRVQSQLDLTSVAEAVLKVDIARISTTAYTNSVDVIIERLFASVAKDLAGSAGSQYAQNAGKSLRNYGGSSGLTASGSVTRVVNTGNSKGDKTISLKTSNTGSTAYGSTFAFLGDTAPGSLTNGQAITSSGTASFEVARTSGFTGSGPWTHTLEAPLGVIHNANDYVTDAVETLEFRLPGGFVYNVSIDAYNISAGAGAVVQAIAFLNPGWKSG